MIPKTTHTAATPKRTATTPSATPPPSARSKTVTSIRPVTIRAGASATGTTTQRIDRARAKGATSITAKATSPAIPRPTPSTPRSTPTTKRPTTKNKTASAPSSRPGGSRSSLLRTLYPGVSILTTLWLRADVTWGGRRYLGPLEDFVREWVRKPIIAKTKHELPLYAPAIFTRNARPEGSIPSALTALIVDLDRNTTVAQAARIFAGHAGVIHTTHRHTTKKPRCRAILLLSRHVTPDEHRLLWEHYAANCKRAGHPVDVKTRNPGRCWWYPAHKPRAPYEVRELHGTAINVDKVLAMPRATEPTESSAKVKAKARGAAPSKVCEETGASDPPATARASARESFIGRAFIAAGLDMHDLAGGRLAVVCPWSWQHTKGGGARDGSDTTIMPPTDFWGAFSCLHEHCNGRTSIDVVAALAEIAPAALAAAREQSGGLGMTVARITRAWPDDWPATSTQAAFKRLHLDLALEDAGEVILDHHLVVPTHGSHASAKIRTTYEAALPDVDPALVKGETWGSATKGFTIKGRRLIVSVVTTGGRTFIRWLRAVPATAAGARVPRDPTAARRDYERAPVERTRAKAERVAWRARRALERIHLK